MLKDLLNKEKEETSLKKVGVIEESTKDIESEIDKYLNLHGYVTLTNSPIGEALIDRSSHSNKAYIGKFMTSYFHLDRQINTFYSRTGIFVGKMEDQYNINHMYRSLIYQIVIDILSFNSVHINSYKDIKDKELRKITDKITQDLSKHALHWVLYEHYDRFYLDNFKVEVKPRGEDITKIPITEIEKEIRQTALKVFTQSYGDYPQIVKIYGYEVEIRPQDLERDYYFDKYIKYMNELENNPTGLGEGYSSEENEEELQIRTRVQEEESIEIEKVNPIWVDYLTDWINHYKDKKIYNYQNPNKKLLWTGITLQSATNRKQIDRLSDINLYVDVSSSVNIKQLRKAFSNLHYVFENTNNKINSYVFNTEVKSLPYETIPKEGSKIHLPIGGGTDIKKVFEHITNNSDKYSVNIVITDGKIVWEDLKREMSGRRVAVLVTGTLNKDTDLGEDIRVFQI